MLPGGVDPRQMQAMMRRMGIQMQDLPDVVEVVVRTKTSEWRIKRPSVSIMKAQGSETWQVQGKGVEVPLGTPAPVPPSAPSAPAGPAGAAREPAAPAASTPSAAVAASGSVPMPTNVPPPLPVSDDDVRLVMKQTGKDAATCRKALEAAGGDLAEAIVALSG